MIKLRPYQEDAISKVYNAWNSSYRNVMLVLPTGAGKCSAACTPILLHDGSIKRADQICKGDTLMGLDSTPRLVTSICTGREEMFKMTPTKGDSHTFNRSHVLTLRCSFSEGNYTQGDLINISIDDYLGKSNNFKRQWKWTRTGVEFPKVKTEFDPYLVGLYLADGSHHQNSICVGNKDIEIKEYIQEWTLTNNMKLRVQDGQGCEQFYFSDYIIKHDKNKIKHLRNSCTTRDNRWLPKEYKINSRDNRLKLLAGLLDGDGYLHNNSYEIITKHDQLKDDILYLCRSLGIAAYSKIKIGKIKSIGFEGEYHRMTISGKLDCIPCKIARKQATPRKQIKSVLNTGFKLESQGEGDYYGFTIGDDHRYLLGDFSITHNTICLTSIVSDCLRIPNASLSTAIMVHRKELVQQISLTLASQGIHHNLIASRKDIRGIIAAHRRMHGQSFYKTSSLVTVISVDTLISRQDVYKSWFPTVQQVIIDEAAHVLKDNKWGKALSLFNNARALGVTATPERLDRKGLGSHADGVFDTMVQGPPTQWMISQGFLSKYKIACPPSDYQDHLTSKSETSDYSKKAMMQASNQSHIVGDVVENYIKFANGKQAILFASDVATAKSMAKRFNARGIPAQSLDGTTPDKERLDGIVKFTEKKTRVLINVDLFDEGLDVPGIECVIMARPTKSLGKFLQMCLDEETEILTKRGWIKHDKMTSNDICAAFNCDTNGIEWCKNQEVFKRERHESEKMFTFNSPQTSIRVTSQHDMISKSRHSKKWIKKTVDETVKRKDTYHVPVNGHETIQSAKLTDDELNFLGWFLSDGTRVKNHYSEVIRIYQCSNQTSRLDNIRKTLNACGFKYSEHEVKRTGDLAKYDSMIHFTITKDKPVRNFKGWENKRGWNSLSKWLDKDLPECYDSLNEVQFKLLLQGFFLGDGVKKLNVDYKVQTMSITCGDNKTQADRFQALAVTRGLRCNISTEDRSHLNKKDCHMLHIKEVGHSSIAGSNVKDGSILGKKPYIRSRFIEETDFKKEIVWCVKNRLGSIVTRRKGKVVVLGNCGRGLRIAPDKFNMILIDHVGNVKHHGLPCKVRRWTLDRISKRKGSLNFIRICWNIECNSPYDRALTECPWCGCEAVINTRTGEGGGGKPSLQEVDGDLELIDPDTIRQLEQQASLEDPARIAQRVSVAANPAAGLRAMKNQQERIVTQQELIQSVAKWAGEMKQYYGYSDRQIHKKYFLRYQETITESLGQPKAQMESMMEQLSREGAW